MADDKPNKGLNIIAIDSKIRTESLKISTIVGDEIIDYGLTNLYPSRVNDIIRESPTANGCVKRKSEFVFGLGIDGGDLVVNRHGQTLNEIYNATSKDYTKYNGFVLHFNVNLLGEIAEIQNVDIRYVRKLATLKAARLARIKDVGLFDDNAFEIALWGIGEAPKNGFLYYFNTSGGIYPICPMEASLTSAQLENETQVFGYMFAKNGYCGSGVLQLPNMPDEKIKKEEYAAVIKKVTDTRSAGSLLVVNAVQNIEGDVDKFKMYEPFMPPNVDALYVNQNKQAKEHILITYNMPDILLGVGSSGMFNKESFQDAFNYYNNDTKRDRLILEEAFNKFWPDTTFTEIKEIKVIPLDDLGIEKEPEKETEEDDG